MSEYNNDKREQLQDQLLQEKQKNSSLSLIYKISKEDLKELFDERFGKNRKPAAAVQSHLARYGGLDGIAKKLASDANSGIIGDERDLERRVKMFGANTMPLPPLPRWGASFLDVAKEKMWWFAAGSAVLAAIGGWIQAKKFAGTLEGVGLLMFAALIVVVIATVDFFKDRRFVQLQQLLHDEEMSVIRGKAFQTRSISVWDLVVGDVVLLESGSRVPADCLILDQENLQFEEPAADDAMSGDSEHEARANDDVFLRAGTMVKSGNAKALVCQVGTQKQESKVELNKDTLLEKKLQNLGVQLSFYALIATAVIAVELIIAYFIKVGTSESAFATFLGELLKMVNFLVILAIASIPEGLPLVIQLSLAFSIMTMYEQDHVLVKDLEAPETMGQIEEILVGKTGTLTKAKMRVAHFIVEGISRVNSRKNTILNCEVADYNLEKLKESILFNTTARIETDETSYVANGSPVDTCMINFLQDADIPVHLMVQRKFGGRLVAQRGFDQAHRTSAVCVENFDDDQTVTVYLKGAPEEVIAVCPQLQARDNDAPEDGHDGKSLKDVTDFAMQGYKVICYAFCEIAKDTWEQTIGAGSGEWSQEQVNAVFAEKVMDNESFTFRLLATFALKDGLRPTAASAVQYARDAAGLKVRLVSNDHIETAKSTARKAGILRADDPAVGAVMTGDDFDAAVGGITEKRAYENKDGMPVQYEELENMDSFKEIMATLKVLARATAEHKKKMVVGLKACGVEVSTIDEALADDDKKNKFKDMQAKISVTGEGVNDVDALKEAQVGLAMGTGCPAAKDASQLVITDNNFQGCLQAVLWGRNIFQNVTRFLQFQLTANLGLILSVAIGVCFFGESPFSPAQLLWINLIMDVLGALALATEPPMASNVKGEPKHQTSLLKQPHVWRQIIGVGIWEALVMTALFAFGKLACGSPVYAPYGKTELAQPLARPTGGVDCPAYPNDVAAVNFGYSAEALADPDCSAYIGASAKVTVLTYAFNVFAFMNLFNLINCRKVGMDDKNVFERFYHNVTFLICFIGTFIGHILLTQYCPLLLRTMPTESRSEWGGAIAVGASTLAIALLLKLTPKSWVEMLPVDRFGVDEDDVPAGDSYAARFHGGYTAATSGSVADLGVNVGEKEEKAAEEGEEDDDRRAIDEEAEGGHDRYARDYS